MRRRGSHSNTSSLFAFQDVMASLIGVLFFIVLFMSMDMLEQKSPAQAQTPTEPAQTELQSLFAQLREQLDTLTREVHDKTDRLNVASSSSDEELLEAVQRLHQRLKYLYATVEQEESEQAKPVAKFQEAKKELTPLEVEAQKLDELIQKLAAKAKAFRSVPRVAYIIDEAPNLEPWLVEVTRDAIRVAAKDGRSSVMTFKADTADARMKQFLSWADTQGKQSCYFVVLIKPSGFSQALEMLSELEKKGFRQGKDLLPEDWKPFDVD